MTGRPPVRRKFSAGLVADLRSCGLSEDMIERVAALPWLKLAELITAGRKGTLYDHDAILALHAQGLGPTAVAVRIGCSRQLAQLVITRHRDAAAAAQAKD